MLGTEQFNNSTGLIKNPIIRFFDTEQAISDTARIPKVIKAMSNNIDGLEVFCLRNAEIENEKESEISRYEFIKKTIEHDKPDFVVIDGIADLIYNYNDVIESQTMVNQLATLANENNCCIAVVMHQNKGKQDVNMKGHLGTMLFQKCSDVFQVEKIHNIFVVSHQVSRHRSCEDIVFQLDENAIPRDATIERQLQIEQLASERKNERLEKVKAIFGDDEKLTRNEMVKRIREQLKIGQSMAYNLVKNCLEDKIMNKQDEKYYTINFE